MRPTGLARMEEAGHPDRPVDMTQHPYTQLAIARARQDDFLRNAERHRLAAAARREAPGLRDRVTALLRRGAASRRESPRVAPAAK